MKVKFQRSGGFANINTVVELDSTEMSADFITSLNEKLAKVLPLRSPEKPTEGADLQNYLLEVETDGQAQTLSINDADASEDMYDLFDFLLKQ